MGFNGEVSLQKNFPDYLRPSIGKGSDDLFICQVLMVLAVPGGSPGMHAPTRTNLSTVLMHHPGGEGKHQMVVTDEMGIIM